MAPTILLTTNTFRDLLNDFNNVVSTLLNSTLTDNTIANGIFTANGSLQVVNSFFANSSTININGNTTFLANASVPNECNVWNFSCGTLLIQPLNGTSVNTAFTVNATTTLLQGLTVNGSVITSGGITGTGNTYLQGTLTANGGPIIAQQLLFASTGATINPPALNNPEYDNFSPSGGSSATIWNLSPSINTVFTGIAAPTNFANGAQVLYIQNLSNTFSISFSSGNTNSSTGNRFENPAVLAPGGVVTLIWTTSGNQWCIINSGTLPAANSVISGNGTFTGYVNVGTTLQVAGGTILTGNIAAITVTGNTIGANAYLTNLLTTGLINIGTSLSANTLNVLGVSSLIGNTTITGFANLLSNLKVSGLTTLTNLTLSGFINTVSTLQVAGLSTLQQVTIANTLSVGGTTALTNLNLSGNINVAGFANVTGSLQTTGNFLLLGNANFLTSNVYSSQFLWANNFIFSPGGGYTNSITDSFISYGGIGSLSNATSSLVIWRRNYDNVNMMSLDGAGNISLAGNFNAPLGGVSSNIVTATTYVNSPSYLINGVAAGIVPAGALIPYAGSSAPTGWLLCDGSAVSRVTYATLFTAIGTTYGIGDGSTTFNLPNTGQKFLLGLASSGTGSVLGSTGGNINHTHNVNGTTDSTSIQHSHTETSTSIQGVQAGADIFAITGLGSTGNMSTNDPHTHTFGATTGTANPPFLTINYLIKY